MPEDPNFEVLKSLNLQDKVLLEAMKDKLAQKDKKVMMLFKIY